MISKPISRYFQLAFMIAFFSLPIMQTRSALGCFYADSDAVITNKVALKHLLSEIESDLSSMSSVAFCVDDYRFYSDDSPIKVQSDIQSWKKISHAYRGVRSKIKLLETSPIVSPYLASVQELKQIKLWPSYRTNYHYDNYHGTSARFWHYGVRFFEVREFVRTWRTKLNSLLEYINSSNETNTVAYPEVVPVCDAFPSAPPFKE